MMGIAAAGIAAAAGGTIKKAAHVMQAATARPAPGRAGPYFLGAFWSRPLCIPAKLLGDLGYPEPNFVPVVVAVLLQQQCMVSGFQGRGIIMPRPQDPRMDFNGFLKRDFHGLPSFTVGLLWPFYLHLRHLATGLNRCSAYLPRARLSMSCLTVCFLVRTT